MGYSIRQEENDEYIKKLFVRDQYHDVFEQQLQTTEREMGSGSIHVLNFYGIGGIGKTSICSLIEKNIRENHKKIKYNYYDFSFGEDVDDVLMSMKLSLENKYKFKFPLFELAKYSLEQKKENVKKDFFNQSFIAQNSCIAQCVEICDKIPVVKELVSMVKLLDAVIAIMQGIHKKYDFKKHIHEMELMSVTELITELPYYFSIDMRNNLEDEKKPFVFLFDTYEKKINADGTDRIRNENWLRGEKGLVRNIPNVLWVISGRTQLRWNEWDSNWTNDILCPCRVDAFSPEDARSYLKESGVTDENILETILGRAKGYPIHLDLYVDYYKKYAGSFHNEIVHMVDETVLVEHIFESYDDRQKELFWYLVCLKKWVWHDIKLLADNIKWVDVFGVYEEIRVTSLIRETERYCFVSEEIWNIMLKHCPMTNIINFCNIWVENSFSFDDSIEGVVRNLDMVKSIDSELYKNVLSGLDLLLKDLLNDFQTERIKSILDMCYRNQGQGSNHELNVVLDTYAILVLVREGEYSKAYQKAIETENDESTYALQRAKSLAMQKNGRYEQAFALNQEILSNVKNDNQVREVIIEQIGLLNMQGNYVQAEQQGRELLNICEISGKNALLAYTEMGTAMYKTGKAHEALAYYQMATQEAKKMNVSNPFIMFDTRCNEATALMGLRKYEDAYNIYSEVYEEYCQRIGREHPLALKVMCNLGSVQSARGDHEKTLEMYKEIHSFYEKIYGVENPETYYILRLISYEQYSCGDIDGAIDNLTKVYDYMLSIYGVDHYEVGKISAILGQMKSEQ